MQKKSLPGYTATTAATVKRLGRKELLSAYEHIKQFSSHSTLIKKEPPAATIWPQERAGKAGTEQTPPETENAPRAV